MSCCLVIEVNLHLINSSALYSYSNSVTTRTNPLRRICRNYTPAENGFNGARLDKNIIGNWNIFKQSRIRSINRKTKTLPWQLLTQIKRERPNSVTTSKHWRCSLWMMPKWWLGGHRTWSFTVILLLHGSGRGNGAYRLISQLGEQFPCGCLFSPMGLAPPPLHPN